MEDQERERGIEKTWEKNKKEKITVSAFNIQSTIDILSLELQELYL